MPDHAQDPTPHTAWPTPATLGERLRRARQQLGISVRTLAERASVDKATIVKLEKGGTPTYRTLVRVCDALGVSVVEFLRPEAGSGRDPLVALHLRGREQREPPRAVEVETGSVETARHRPIEARELVAADDRVLLSWLDCRLPGGKLNSWLLELRGPTEPTTHPGEEFLFCLRGRARLTVAGRPYILGEGDAATFWSGEMHGYEPAEPLGTDEPSVLLLSVWISARDSRPRRQRPGGRSAPRAQEG